MRGILGQEMGTQAGETGKVIVVESLCQCGNGRGKQGSMGKGNKLARASLDGCGSLLGGGGGKRESDMPKVVGGRGSMACEDGLVFEMNEDFFGRKNRFAASITE